jgi:hypothetical protein
VGEGETLGVGLGLTLGVGEGETLGVGLGLTLGVGLGLAATLKLKVQVASLVTSALGLVGAVLLLLKAKNTPAIVSTIKEVNPKTIRRFLLETADFLTTFFSSAGSLV